MKDGLLIINKPKGITSHDVVDAVRRKLSIRRVGHAGTLDPLATGVLVILIGRYTKFFNKFLGMDKEYEACLTLGNRTTTGDVEGKVVETKDFKHVTQDMVRKVFSAYTGEIMQTPPMVSALKHKGKRLYALARKGIEVKREPRKLTIKELRLLDFSPPNIRFYLKCSSGTYVRQLGEDIARDLGCAGCISKIQRQGVGAFRIDQAIALSDIAENLIIRALPVIFP